MVAGNGNVLSQALMFVTSLIRDPVRRKRGHHALRRPVLLQLLLNRE